MAQITMTFDSMEEFLTFAAGKLTLKPGSVERLTSIGALDPNKVNSFPMNPPVETVPEVQIPTVQTPPVQTPEAPAPVIPVASATTVAEPAASVQPTAEPMTVERLQKAAQYFMDASKVPVLTAMIQSFGVQRISELKQDQLEAFAAAMREKGATV